MLHRAQIDLPCRCLRNSQAPGANRTGGGGGVNAGMMEMMEQQLGSLSQIIRSKDQELAALKETVQLQCNERVEMLLELNNLRSGASSVQKGGAGKGAGLNVESDLPPQTGRGRGVSPKSRAGTNVAPGSPWRTKRSGWH